MTLDRAFVREWLKAWRADSYDLDYDSALPALRGRPSFSVEDVTWLLGWKLKGLWAPRHQKLFRERNSPGAVVATTGRAFAEPSEAAALEMLCSLGQIGPPTASALLMAQDPDRYTVLDRRALASLRSLRFLKNAPDRPNSVQWRAIWLEYLAACREIVALTGLSLREVDQGLWAANGRPGMPPNG